MRWLWRAFRRLPFRVRVAVVACAPLVMLNGSVAFFGHSVVFPLSPFSLEAKAQALGAYARHRPLCLFTGHGELPALAAAAERKHGLPKGLMQAVVEVESGGHAHRISFAGAMGPAQLMPATAKALQVRDPYDPREAIDAGARYLAQLIKRNGDVQLGLAAYNAGPGAVRGSIPQNGETEHYVAEVMRRHRALR